MPTPFAVRGLAVVLPLLALGTACGSDSQDPVTQSQSPTTPAATAPTKSASSAPTQAPEPEGQVIEVGIKGDDVSPNGDRIKVDLDAGVTLLVTSDRIGELHVHSTPEQVVPFTQGTTRIPLKIDTPGVVEVEDHDSGKVLMTLQVQ